MKANEAPEKIHISIVPNSLNSYTYITCSKDFPNAVEYTCTDAFINKALKWYCLDCECNDNCKDVKCFFYREYERYLKGDTNAIPPKFSDSILNEDGSTSDDWRYRHFIKRMQDAFIEKAKKWLEKNVDNYTWYNEMEGESGMTDDFIDDFKKYMKGE